MLLQGLGCLADSAGVAALHSNQLSSLYKMCYLVLSFSANTNFKNKGIIVFPHYTSHIELFKFKKHHSQETVINNFLGVVVSGNSGYIFSGADTPIRFSALAMVVRVAVISARRASDSSRLAGSKTFSAL
jgi:hypothetical protein